MKIRGIISLSALLVTAAGCSKLNSEPQYTYISGLDGDENHRVEYTEIDGTAMYEGDIVLGTISEVKAYRKKVEKFEKQPGDQQSIRANQLVGKRYLWPDGLVPYEISSTITATGRKNLQTAINIIHEKTNVRLVPKQNISRYNGNSITFKAGSNPRVCSSRVGMRGGNQSINFGGGSCSVDTIIHEIAHALGTWHEQSRSDRDRYVEINWNNIEKKHQHNFKKRTHDGKVFGTYDCQSIMHYSKYAFAINPSIPTVNPKSPACVISRNGLSQTDIHSINNLYPLKKVSGGLVTKVSAWGDPNQCGGRTGDVIFSPFGRFGRPIIMDTDERGGGCKYGFGVVDSENMINGNLGMKLSFSGPSNQCSGTGNNIPVPFSSSFDNLSFSRDIVVDTDNDSGGCLLTLSISDPTASIDLIYPDNSQCSICTSASGKCRDANKSRDRVTSRNPVRLWIDADNRSGGCSLRLRPNPG